jgi:copper(I)-binding protein
MSSEDMPHLSGLSGSGLARFTTLRYNSFIGHLVHHRRNTMLLKKTLLIAALLSPSLFANAHDYSVGNLHIEHPWSRAMPPVAPTAAAYFVVHNKGSDADRLLSASTPVAGKAELHEHIHADGLMKMQQVQGVEIPAGGEVKFEPMGYHVMLFNLKQQAKDGERFPLTLTFEKAGAVEVEIAVQADAPESADHAEKHHH